MIKFVKRLIRNYSNWDDFMSTVNFYKLNPHSIPGITQLLCKMGRHDYEAVKVDKIHKRIILECFYCLHKKGSSVHDTHR